MHPCAAHGRAGVGLISHGGVGAGFTGRQRFVVACWRPRADFARSQIQRVDAESHKRMAHELKGGEQTRVGSVEWAHDVAPVEPPPHGNNQPDNKAREDDPASAHLCASQGGVCLSI
eukprot:Amastigsp_a844982_11.p4 type:complete len:117 gc:universal Amastigsp_a844982_11:585-935(+)